MVDYNSVVNNNYIYLGIYHPGTIQNVGNSIYMTQGTYRCRNSDGGEYHTFDTVRRPVTVLRQYVVYPQIAVLAWGKQCGFMQDKRDMLYDYAKALQNWRFVCWLPDSSILLARNTCKQPETVLMYLWRQATNNNDVNTYRRHRPKYEN